MMRTTTSLLLVSLLAACGPDPMAVQVTADPAIADFSSAVLGDYGAELTVYLVNHGTTQTAVQDWTLSGDAAPALQVRDIERGALVPVEGDPLPLRLVITSPSAAALDAVGVLELRLRGYGGLGDTTTLDVPVWLTGAPDTCERDEDGDGATACTDCDDANPDVFPGAQELCNGVDDDCSGAVDDNPVDPTTWYPDSDGDSYGLSTLAELACTAPTPASVQIGGDCDDTQVSVNPAAEELCDGLDNNCDGQADEGLGDQVTLYPDMDGDAYGDGTRATATCGVLDGYVSVAGDCDDTVAASHPGAVELCDGLDNDCNGLADDGTTPDGELYFADTDGDGFGDATVTTNSCARPPGFVQDATDCDDANPMVNPAVAEQCDGLDNNCDGRVDEGASGSTFYSDRDGDSFGDLNSAQTACVQPPGTVSNATDCDDTQPTVYPGNVESCDNLDNNCNGQVDEGWTADGLFFYPDADGDLFGANAGRVRRCSAPPSFVTDNADCDDTQAAINPGAAEQCDGLDNNCNGQVDEGASGGIYYADRDGDTYGDPLNVTESCLQPPGTVTNKTDCDDTNPAMYPGKQEQCDGFDNNCDGQVDEGWTPDGLFFFPDTDGDNYGAATGRIRRCVAPPKYVADNTDCDDTNKLMFPGNPERCDGFDNNCDGQVDEGWTPDGNFYWADKDLDGYGADPSRIRRCAAPAGYVDRGSDCLDTNALVNPGHLEVCGNALDDDCDGAADVSPFDSDVDGRDNCNDRTVYAESFTGLALANLGSIGWSQADFAATPSGIDTPLPAPVPPPPAPGASTWWISVPEMLRETSGLGHSAMVSPDHGLISSYTVAGSVVGVPANGRDGNDALGIFVAFTDTSNYVLVRWDNPSGTYGRYFGQSSVDIIQCYQGACSTIASTNGMMGTGIAGYAYSLQARVSGTNIALSVDGIPLLSGQLRGGEPVGPRHIGAYAFSDEAGVIFDDFAITVP